jgi:hypothetical protein
MSAENTGPGFLSNLTKGKYNLWIFVGVALGVGYWMGKKAERAGLRSQMSRLQQGQQISGMGSCCGPVPVSGMGNMQDMQGRNSMGFEPVNLGSFNPNNPCPDNTPASQQVPSEEFEFMG